ncbi:hypothetical protein NVSP9465_01408 [Novosphingobium sp. CECT 9465]|nr:hypothetical protein NVSP9465_01408 [Novosphingobium sp. CECT 9465]
MAASGAVNGENPMVLHRSPPVSQTGATRLLLCSIQCRQPIFRGRIGGRHPIGDDPAVSCAILDRSVQTSLTWAYYLAFNCWNTASEIFRSSPEWMESLSSS